MAFERDPDLPDALYDDAGQGAPMLNREEILAKLGQSIAAKITQAVTARKASGIEKVWLTCEEAYLCIDDMNRHEFVGQTWAKPMTMEAPVRAYAGAADGTQGNRSTAFVRLTSRYVDMAAAKISEIVLPIDEKAFTFKESPVPDAIDPTVLQASTPAQMGMPAPGQAPQMGMPPAGQAMPQMPAPALAADPTAVAKAGKSLMAQYAERAEKRIYDWMVEAKYPAQMRRVIKDAARIGVGILKGPFPDERKRRAITKGPDGTVKVTKKTKIVPSYKRVDPWNFYPHKACGEDVRTGDYVVEEDRISADTLRKLKELKDVESKAPIYLPSAIDEVLQEGPGGHLDKPSAVGKAVDRDRFTVWYYTGIVTREDMQAAGALMGDLPEELTDIPAIVTMVNDRVIRAQVNPQPDGEFGYHVMPWTPREGSWAGVGVAEQVSMAQKTVNAGTRAVFNNAGISGGVQIVLRQDSISPADGSWSVTPNKLWFMTPDATVDDVRKIFMAVDFPNLTAQLLPIVEYGFRLAEEASNIPLISQGQTGPQDPQTFGQAELQNSNANALLRHIAYTLDDQITEPVVQASYDWLLLDPDVPAEEKGDWEINAHGSISMVEKAIQEATLMQMGALVVNPVFELDPALWAEEMLRAKRMDPRKLQLSDEKKAAMANQQPPEAPQVTAANINAKARIKAAQITARLMQRRIEVDTDRDATYVAAETERTQSEHEARMAELQVKRELAMLDYANKREITLEQVKAALAGKAMQLQVQRDLSLAAHVANASAKERDRQAAPETSKPPTEPAGKAPVGQAYEA